MRKCESGQELYVLGACVSFTDKDSTVISCLTLPSPP